MTPSRSQAIRKPSRKSTNHRRFLMLAIALLVALAAGAAMFTAVLAGPKPMAQAPDTPTPAPTRTTAPTEPPSETSDQPGRTDSVTGNDAEEGSGAQTGERAPTRPQTTTPPPPASDYAYYKNCGQARKAGVTPLYAGDPGYSAELDKDADGTACETGKD